MRVPAASSHLNLLYTAGEVAELLRMNLQVIHRKLRAGELPGYRIGRGWRVGRDQLLTWLERHSNQRRVEVESWFDVNGRLRAIPARRSRRSAVLAVLVGEFEAARPYAKVEVNALLRRFHHDVASIRREMVAERLLVRTKAGIYKVTGNAHRRLTSGLIGPPLGVGVQERTFWPKRARFHF